ncbi:unnamed protein product, partial [Mesorhabditis spiculigera]
MVRSTGVLNMTHDELRLHRDSVTVAWLFVGLQPVSGDDHGGIIGGLEHIGMAGIDPSTVHGNVPEVLFATFH